jgi:hypothetical protein
MNKDNIIFTEYINHDNNTNLSSQFFLLLYLY